MQWHSRRAGQGRRGQRTWCQRASAAWEEDGGKLSAAGRQLASNCSSRRTGEPCRAVERIVFLRGTRSTWATTLKAEAASSRPDRPASRCLFRAAGSAEMCRVRQSRSIARTSLALGPRLDFIKPLPVFSAIPCRNGRYYRFHIQVRVSPIQGMLRGRLCPAGGQTGPATPLGCSRRSGDRAL